jgi:hypothetical protein
MPGTEASTEPFIPSRDFVVDFGVTWRYRSRSHAREVTMKVILRLALILGLMSIVPVQSIAQTYEIVAPATIPGWNATNTADVLRFEVKKNGPLSSIAPIPANLTNDPAFVAFNSRGELFVGNVMAMF